MIIGTWFVIQRISQSFERQVLAPPSRLTLIIGLWLVSQGISKCSEFLGGGSAVEIGFDFGCDNQLVREFLDGIAIYNGIALL